MLFRGTLRLTRSGQPSYSPELNHAERVCEDVRRWTEGKVYKSVERSRKRPRCYLHYLDRNPDSCANFCG